MSQTEQTISSARSIVAPCMGAITLALVARRGVTRAAVADWVDRLRAAADRLEDLL